MPKTRLHTKWDPIVNRWKVYLSMRNDPNRAAVDILDTREEPPSLIDLEDSEAINSYLRSLPEYQEESRREDHNREAVLTNKDQLADYGVFLDRALQVLSVSSIFVLINNSVDLYYKQQQADKNSAISYEQSRNQSIWNLISPFLVAGLAVGGQFYLSHLRRHKINNAKRTHIYTEELLARVDDIKKEVQLKKRVLGKLEDFLRIESSEFSLDQNYIGISRNKKSDTVDPEKGKDSDKSDVRAIESVTYRTQIIFAIDKSDDLSIWEEIDKTLEGLLYQESRLIILSHMKISILAKYAKLHPQEIEKVEFFKNVEAILGFFEIVKNFYDSNTRYGKIIYW